MLINKEFVIKTRLKAMSIQELYLLKLKLRTAMSFVKDVIGEKEEER